MAVWSTEAVREFISLYKSHTCLWKVSSPNYCNRRARNAAYEVLLKYCKEIGFKTATQDFVRKKIMHLRGAFGKELRKVITSMKRNTKPEDVHKPSLWYFDLLLFIKDQDSVKDDDKETTNDKHYSDDDSSGENEASQLHTVQLPSYNAGPKKLKIIKKDQSSYRSDAASDGSDNEDSFNGTGTSCSQPEPKKRRASTGVRLPDISEYDAVGVAIARKLQRMDQTQCLYAETIINTVLRKGLTRQLTDVTDLCDNHCNRSYNIDEFK